MNKMIILVGPPGSGKSTLAKKHEADGYLSINQDRDGGDHVDMFLGAIDRGYDLTIDRMNFNNEQRLRYIGPALNKGYEVEIVVLHESYDTCFTRIMARKDHETIKDEKSARGALRTFFTKYERPYSYDDTTANGVLATENPELLQQLKEKVKVRFVYPEGPKPKAVVSDLDGTLCNVEHRRHFVRREGKKDWAGFFRGIADDTINVWCKEILDLMAYRYDIVFCSGRGQELEQTTRNWLDKHIKSSSYDYSLFMRHVGDHRQDYIVKEIILDFEILTRWTPYFFIDDRKQVYDMWRRRGFVCLACDEGNF